MMIHRILVAIILVAVYTPLLFSAENHVNVKTVTPVEICPSCNSVRILIDTDNNLKINLNENPRIEAIYFNSSSPRNANKFSTKWVGERNPWAIEISLDENETRQTGTYDLYLNLQPISNPHGGFLKIQLLHPAASLDPTPKLIIDRTYWFIALSSTSKPKLRINETSNKSGITISSIRPVSNSVIGNTPIGGSIEFLKVPFRIKPGEQVSLDYNLDGCFEIGSATGTIKINAPELASPVSFEFEVRSHAHWIWIGITIFIGLLTSYFLKVKLQQTIELNQARVEANKLIDRVKSEEKQHSDPNFICTYQNELKALDAVNKEDDADAINKAVSALDKKWQAELTEHIKKHQDEEQNLEKLQLLITSPHWLVPSKIVEAITEAHSATDDVEDNIKHCQLAEANKERNNIVIDLGDKIKELAIEWQDNEQNIIKMILAGPRGIPSTLSDWLTQATPTILNFLNKVDVNSSIDSIELLQSTLNDIRSERSAIKEFFYQLGNCYSGKVCASAVAVIQDQRPANWKQDVFAEVTNAVKGFTNFLEGLVDNPDLPSLSQELSKIHQAWINALQSQFSAPDDKVKELLSARDYVNATATTVQKLIHANKAITGSLTVSGAKHINLAPFQPGIESTNQPIYASHFWYRWITTPVSVVGTAVTPKDQLKKEKRIQSGIIFLLLTFAGYGLQLDKFIGTFTDFSSLFFWAFALDLTVDQVIKITKKI
jgi:hypothetical protein